MSNMNIACYFDKKKRDLSEESKEGDVAKKVREDNSGSFEQQDDVFNDDNNFKDLVHTALKSLEKQIKQIHDLATSTQESQIKGEGQLAELTKSVNLISARFDEYEEDRKRKEEVINSLRKKVCSLSETVGKLEAEIDDQEQYSRRNCLLIHGVTEDKKEDTDSVVINIIKNDVEVEISENDIDRTHRIGAPKNPGERPRPIIVKFARYNVRKKVFKNKKRLKGKKTSITESLTKNRMEKLKQARDEFGFGSVWTYDGKIMVQSSSNPSDKPKVYYP